LNLKYTITEGKIIGENINCEIPFALVSEENGLYFIETFLKEGFYDKSSFSKRFSLIGKTEKGYRIEIEDLTFTLYQHNNHKAKLVCRNYVKLTEIERNSQDEEDEEIEDSILFLEIEGFRTKFANHTDIKKYRQYGKVDDFNVNFDHTSCSLYIQIEGYEENYFHLIFSQSKTDDSILIDFTKNGGYGRLTYKHFQIFKEQFVGFLSLLNGGNVFIRKELTGNSYTVDGSDSHIVYNYSFTKNSSNYSSNYIPINEHHSYSSSIFYNAFSYSFNQFYHNDLKLDLISTVSSLNSAFITSGIHQAYSILINALEKLCTNYQMSIGEFDENLIDNKVWEENIKPTLIKVLESQKAEINSTNINAFRIFKSKIGDLNRRKNSTVQKMYDLLKFGFIPINQNVENLVTNERHSAVHNGEFGEDYTEMIINFQKLDHILRDIILNVIDYRGYRKCVYEYASLEERKEAYPERKRETITYVCSQQLRN
jgi:hypothetical protein